MGLTSLSLLFTLSAIGISETVYLIRKRKAQSAPICFIGSDCHTVLESKYNKILGIHNDILGLGFYIFLCFLCSILLIGIGPIAVLKNLVLVMIFSGSVMSIYFTYLQGFVIKAWCFWCLGSAITIWTMMLILIFSGFII